MSGPPAGLYRPTNPTVSSDSEIRHYRAYLKLTFLALERARRSVLKRNAEARVEILSRQLSRLAQAERSLLLELGDLGPPRKASPSSLASPLRFRY